MVTLDQAGRGARWTRIIAPDTPLRRFIEFQWLQAWPGTDPSVCAWRIVADARPHLIASRFHDASGRVRTRVSIVGSRSHWVDGDFSRRDWVAGVRLRNGVLPLLARLPATDFTDRSVPLQDVLGSQTWLMERLEAAGGAADAACAVAGFLARELDGRPAPDPRLGTRAWAGMEPVTVRIRDLAVRAGTSERSLRRLFAEGVGLPPVRALRIERLHRVLGLALARAAGWARIAAQTGYSDQSHMIREFRTLLGESPRRFLRRRAATP